MREAILFHENAQKAHPDIPVVSGYDPKWSPTAKTVIGAIDDANKGPELYSKCKSTEELAAKLLCLTNLASTACLKEEAFGNGPKSGCFLKENVLAGTPRKKIEIVNLDKVLNTEWTYKKGRELYIKEIQQTVNRYNEREKARETLCKQMKWEQIALIDFGIYAKIDKNTYRAKNNFTRNLCYSSTNENRDIPRNFILRITKNLEKNDCMMNAMIVYGGEERLTGSASFEQPVPVWRVLSTQEAIKYSRLDLPKTNTISHCAGAL